MSGHGERELVEELNAYFEYEGIQAYAYRQKQGRGYSQNCDITVDSLHHAYYLAIEVKSMRGKRPLNFKSDFSVDKHGTHQLDRETEFADKTGRYAIVYLVCRMGSGYAQEHYIFDSHTLNDLRHAGNASVRPKDFDSLHVGHITEDDFGNERR